MRTTIVFTALLALAATVAAGPRQDRVTISEETTRITEPLTEDGYPDYVAALNARLSEGVTPENNAAVLFLRALGPEYLEAEFRERYFAMLGMEQPAEEGDYLDDTALRERNYRRDDGADLYERMESATTRPWTRAEFREIAWWLAKSRKSLGLLTEGAARARCHFPLVATGNPALVSAEMPQVRMCMLAKKALLARGMHRIGQRQPERAMEDLLTLHQIARHVGQGPMLIMKLVAFTLDGAAFRGDAVLAHHGGLDGAALRQYAARLRDLPPVPDLVQALGVGERFMFLDTVCTLSDDPAALLDELELPSIIGVDYDLILRMGNDWFDRAVGACRRPTLAKRMEAAAALRIEKPDLKRVLISALSREGRSKLLGDVLLAMFALVPDLISSYTVKFETRAELTQVALLLAHRADHGAYPEKLTAVLGEVPIDPFTGKPVVYAKTEEGFVLKSAGRDGEFAPESEDGDADDIVIRVP